MNLLPYILAPLISMGAHEMGHEVEASHENVPLEWDGGLYYADTKDKDKLAKVGGAGFRTADALAEALSDTKLERAVRTANALNKIGYALFPESLQGGEGDVALINRGKGNNFGQAALAISALGDLYKGYIQEQPANWNLNYWQSDTGTPGLQFTYRW